MKEVIRLQNQQEYTQDTIKQILGELIASRKKQDDLLNKVQDISNQTLTNVPLLTVEPRTMNDFLSTSSGFQEVTTSPDGIQDNKPQSILSNTDSLESLLSADNFFSLDELPQFDLTSSGLDSFSDLNRYGEQIFVDQ